MLYGILLMRSELAETGKASTKYCIVIEVGIFGILYVMARLFPGVSADSHLNYSYSGLSVTLVNPPV